MTDTPRERAVTIDPWPVAHDSKSISFSVLQFRCCRHLLEIKRPTAERDLARARIRRATVKLRPEGTLLARAKRRRTTLRAKVTRVGINRFVWRFELGPGAF